MIGQLNLFTTPGRDPLAAAPAVTPGDEDTIACLTEPASRPEPPKRTQMRGPLPGTTSEDAFGGEAA